jgi:monoamine oxidase
MSRSADFDVVVIGAGAAGVGAGRALAEAGSRFVVLEARDRIGGRAWTVDSGRGHPIDLGCEWLHSADINPLVPLAREVGVEVDEHAAVWASKWIEAQLGAAAYADYRAAVEALYDGAAALAEADGPDVPWSDFLEPGSRWRAPLDVVCGWITGVRLDQVSAVDAGRNQETMVNWRLPGGYGALIERFAADLPVRLATPVTRVDWGGGEIAVETPAGRLTAGRVIVTLPTNLLAAERIDFTPALPAEKLQAAADLPLGADLKLFLAIEGDPFGGLRDSQINTRFDRIESSHMHLQPFGWPLVGCYFGGDLARDLEAAGLAEMAAFAEDELAFACGEKIRGNFTALAASAWMADPLAGGAYSYTRPGAVEARATLAKPLEDRIFFAGEATSGDHYATAHGAFTSGQRAAREALALAADQTLG